MHSVKVLPMGKSCMESRHTGWWRDSVSQEGPWSVSNCRAIFLGGAGVAIFSSNKTSRAVATPEEVTLLVKGILRSGQECH